MLMRAVEERDFAEVIELANWAYRGRANDVASWNQEAGLIDGVRLTESLLRDELAGKPHGTLLVFREEDDGPLLGTAWVDPLAGGLWHLGLLTVRPAMQTRKLGTRILGMAEGFARERGGQRMRIEVLAPREALIAWYERRGYVRTGEREPFPYHDARFGTPLRGDLEFVVLEKRLESVESYLSG